jgi:hypothetical protein
MSAPRRSTADVLAALDAMPSRPAGEDPSWHVRVQEMTYGPYRFAQMQAFITEGRVKAHTGIGRSAQGPFTPAHTHAELAGLLAAPAAPKVDPEAGRRATIDTDSPANFVVVADIRSGFVDAFAAQLEGFGLVARASENVWVLRARTSAAALRRGLAQQVRPGDKFMIVDASRDRLSWFNFGPQNDVAIRNTWDAPLADDTGG